MHSPAIPTGSSPIAAAASLQQNVAGDSNTGQQPHQSAYVAKDEFTLSQAMRADQAGGGIGQLEDHYKTFITEKDIAQIAGSGLNFLRIPIPFWAIETYEGEPYLEKTAWTYLLKALGWARKYGLRVCLDLHAVPGSQNGYNHSGKLAGPNFMVSNMGLANAERTLYYIRVLTEFISQPEYRELVPIFGIVNEALINSIGLDQMTSFYLRAHTMIREITGTGKGNGPFIAIHNGLIPGSSWDDFLAGSDRIMMDQHPYFAFGGQNTNPIATDASDMKPGGTWPAQACRTWGSETDRSRATFGFTIAGEFSSAPNDCGLFINGVPGGTSNPQCPEYLDYQNYNSSMKQGLRNFLAASADSFGDWFYWTWKIDPDIDGKISAPTWSYQLGLENGWIDLDPRGYKGECAELQIATSSMFDGTYQPWQLGVQTSSIAQSSSVEFPWPPTTISSVDVPMALLPTYTTTGSVITMAPETFTGAPSRVTGGVDGWFDDNDKEGGVVRQQLSLDSKIHNLLRHTKRARSKINDYLGKKTKKRHTSFNNEFQRLV
ncbi:glycoside hydrolase family 5 protein [Dendrothele bispora CBS 962.96]|uniref:glucan 1,3-beta-glucosidase n=1 Tax=Dendrothele bispora (strain CBS 962.96) TaxID=1314807 RepID=A0A4S8KSP7_DENBC|nr:glycoside hydrolase family 5 protein [Dendrothele bispora CBS 962.96]